MEEFKAEQIALNRYLNGEKYSVSTFIDEDSIVAGYGRLDLDFEFPLPSEIIRMEHGTLSWTEWFKLKGYYRYKMTNKSDKSYSSVSPLYNEEELAESKVLNPNFTFEKIK